MIINTPVEKEPAKLLCTEGQIRYKGERVEFGTLPEYISNGSVGIDDMVYLDGNLYVLAHSGGKINNAYRLILYKYDKTSWTEVEVHNSAGIFTNCVLQIYSSAIIIISAYDTYSSSTYAMLWSLNTSTFKATNIGKRGNAIPVIAKNESDEEIYWLLICPNGSTTMLYRVTGNSASTLMNIPSIASTYQPYGAYIDKNDGRIVVGTTNNGSNYLFRVDKDSGYTTMHNRSVGYNAYKMSKYIKNELYQINSSTYKELCVNEVGVCQADAFTEYDNSILIFCTDQKDASNNKDKYFKKIKPYKILYAYAKQGDILQCGDSFAISDNLEAIDNGYIVTETGNVEIGLYL